MTATAAMRSRLRRMVDETDTQGTYTDAVLDDYIEAYPIWDSNGNESGETDWVATYDLNAAAADIWEEKAALVYDKFNFTTAGEATFQRSTKYDNCMKQARHYRARRVAKSKVVKVSVQPTISDLNETDTPWIGNVNDPYD